MQTDLLKRLENMVGDCMIGPMRTLKTGDLADVLYDAHEEIERLRASEAKLREALECLIDEQNGPPLLGHERSWCAAMEKARAALGEEKK